MHLQKCTPEGDCSYSNLHVDPLPAPLPCLWLNLWWLAEKAMATHSSTLAWKIPWTEEPGGLQSMGSPRFEHGRAASRSLFTSMHWRRKWQPTPVFLHGESPGILGIPGEPGGLPSMGSHRVRHDWNDWAAVAAVVTGAIRFSYAAFTYSALSCSSEQVFLFFLSTKWLCSFEVIYLLPSNFLLYSFLASKCDYTDNLLWYILSNVVAFIKGILKNIPW